MSEPQVIYLRLPAPWGPAELTVRDGAKGKVMYLVYHDPMQHGPLLMLPPIVFHNYPFVEWRMIPNVLREMAGQT